MTWQAKPVCPAHLRDVLERFINDRDPAWRVAPAPKGEIFSSFQQCHGRLNVWAMVEVFAVVITAYGQAANPSGRFACIHHHDQTRNDRELEDQVEKDSEDKIVSKRQRNNTRTKQKGCKWSAYCSYKNTGKRESGIKGYCLVAKELFHSHCFAESPLIYTEN